MLNSTLLPLPQADRRASVSICQEESSRLFPLALHLVVPGNNLEVYLLRGRGLVISAESDFALVLQTCPLVLGPKAVTSS